MTTSKDLKRLVRARMTRTGESYTAARAQIIRKSAATPAAPAVNYGALAGMADARIQAKTGRTWKEWTRFLDGQDGTGLRHRERAALVQAHGVTDWWSQMVAVGYERIKGMRARGQRMDGSYEASKSRTFPVSVARLYDAWASPARRRTWLADAGLTLRTKNRPKYVRFRRADGTVVLASFMAKGRAKSTVSVQHSGLPSRDAVTASKAFWADRLDRLGNVLG